MAGKNAEGYPDPTASIAIGLVTKKEKEKEKMKDTANPEEIWMIQSAQGDVPALVLADDGQTAVFIKLRKTSIRCHIPRKDVCKSNDDTIYAERKHHQL